MTDVRQDQAPLGLDYEWPEKVWLVKGLVSGRRIHASKSTREGWFIIAWTDHDTALCHARTAEQVYSVTIQEAEYIAREQDVTMAGFVLLNEHDEEIARRYVR